MQPHTFRYRLIGSGDPVHCCLDRSRQPAAATHTGSPRPPARDS